MTVPNSYLLQLSELEDAFSAAANYDFPMRRANEMLLILKNMALVFDHAKYSLCIGDVVDFLQDFFERPDLSSNIVDRAFDGSDLSVLPLKKRVVQKMEEIKRNLDSEQSILQFGL